MFQEKCITKRTNFQHSLMKRILKHLLTQTVGGHQQWCRHLVTYFVLHHLRLHSQRKVLVFYLQQQDGFQKELKQH